MASLSPIYGLPRLIPDARLRRLVSLAARIASVFRSIAIVIAIAVVFLFGVATTVYLSLRSPETTVPDVVGKNRFEAEKILAEADLKFRVRATRPTNQAERDTVMFQLPRAGEVVKAGQTVAMDISRPAKEGESSETVIPDEPSERRNTNTNSNERPRRPRPRNTNENANGNANTNANGNRNANSNTTRPANINRPNANAAVNANTTPRANVNRGNVNARPGNVNARPANVNARPPVTRPSPPRP